MSAPDVAPPSHPDLSRQEVRAAVLSLLVGIVLLTAKLVAYLLTDSAAIFSDALESIVNVLAASLALYSIVLAHRPADVDHPYGHGKVEFMSAGFEGGMMMVAALVILLRGVEQLVGGPRINSGQIPIGLALVGGAGAVNLVVGLYLVQRGRKGGSLTLEADGKHLLADAVTSAGVLAALALVKLTGWPRLDPLAAVVAAAWVAREAWSLLRRSAAGLMDERDIADDTMVRGILDSHIGSAGKEPRICSYHKLRMRHTGRYHWVDFHIMVPAALDVRRGHEIASAIEYEIELALAMGNATAHVEPCLEAACAACGEGVRT
jgi:cation diffusion facilitator family transporter